MWGIIPSTSELELHVPVSVHPAPDILRSDPFAHV